MTVNVDARGLSCPQPVILTRNAIQKAASGQIIVLVDTMTQVHNCSRAAEKLGWQVQYEEKGDVFELTLTKASPTGDGRV
jgi:TusA-related sulfurtransferase